VPTGLTNVVAIAAGYGYHTLALKADGTVAAWGNNYYGADDGADGADQRGGPSRRRPIHSLALKADGTVVAWGNNAERSDDGADGADQRRGPCRREVTTVSP
jgi:alpha-tubulin suppressor-like RCC1 family protein